MLKVLGILDCDHCFGEGSAHAGALQQRRVERLHGQLDGLVRHRPQRDEHALSAGREQGPRQRYESVRGHTFVFVVAAGDDDELGGQLQPQDVGRRQEELGERGHVKG